MDVGNIKKSKTGNIVLKVEREKIEKFRNKIRDKIERVGDDMEVAKGDMYFLLTGTSEEEIREATTKTTGAGENNIILEDKLQGGR